jgi:3-deoxy-7-phosphoheptulonate synthase
MIVTVKRGADSARVQRELTGRGLWTHLVQGEAGVSLVIEPHSTAVPIEQLLGIEGVQSVATTPSAHPKVDAQPATVDVAGVRFGAGEKPVLMGGPCCVEDEAQIQASAQAVAASGGEFLRGGAYKPRTSPYSFAGHGEPALRWLRQAAERQGLRVVTEALRPEDAGLVAEYAHLIQIGSRNMQNFALLAAVAQTRRPVLLKRAASATIEEWLLAAEHCLAHGAAAVVFCERGIRSFDPSVRNLLDLGAVSLLSQVLHQPVVVDPSHAAGRRDLIEALSNAALAAGAHGLLIETHPDPANAQSDGPQALPPASFRALARTLRFT